MKTSSYKYNRIFYYGLMAGAAIGILIMSYFLMCYNTPISHFHASLNDEDYLQIQLSNKHYVFDTGANVTVICSDTVPGNSVFSISKDVTDIHGNKSSGKVYLLNHFKLGELEARFQTCMIRPEQYLFGDVSGILGTDVISRADWCIDFKEKKIMAGSTIPEHYDFMLEYNVKNNLYYADLEIGNLTVKDIMIDTGYSRSDFVLEDKIRQSLKGLEFSKTDTCFSFTNAKEVYEIYSKNECLLNDMYIEKVTFSFSANRNILGLDFFKRFSSVHIDSDNCRIYCCK